MLWVSKLMHHLNFSNQPIDVAERPAQNFAFSEYSIAVNNLPSITLNHVDHYSFISTIKYKDNKSHIRTKKKRVLR